MHVKRASNFALETATTVITNSSALRLSDKCKHSFSFSPGSHRVSAETFPILVRDCVEFAHTRSWGSHNSRMMIEIKFDARRGTTVPEVAQLQISIQGLPLALLRSLSLPFGLLRRSRFLYPSRFLTPSSALLFLSGLLKEAAFGVKSG